MHYVPNRIAPIGFGTALPTLRGGSRFLTVLLAAVLACFAAVRAPLAQTVESIAAVVNDEAISTYDLEARLRLALAVTNLPNTEENRKRLLPRVLRGLIDERLQLQEARRLNITVTDEELQSAIAQIERQNNLPPGGLQEFLRRNDVGVAAMTEQIRANIAWSKIIRRQVRPQVEVGEDEIDEYLDRLRARGGGTEYLVSEIFLAADSPSEEQSALQTAQRLVEQIRQGTSFQALASQFSQAPTAAVGGDLGTVRDGQLDARLDEALQSMSPGEVAGPIAVDNGFYVLLLRNRRQVDAPSVGDTEIALRRIFLQLPPGASVEEVETQSALARTVSETVTDCADMETLGAEVGAAQPIDVGRLKVGDLPVDLRNTVSRLEVGEASQPVRLGDGFVVLMVCEREQPMTGLPDREEVLRAIGGPRIEMLARRYLRDLRRVAYVDVRLEG